MKDLLAASLLFATLTSANSHNARYLPRNYRRANVSTKVVEELTTLTVLTTAVRTVISCAATVTNCPANPGSLTSLASAAPEQVSTILVTDTIELATTICPVTAVAAVSSSLLSAAATGGIAGYTVATPTVVTPTVVTPTGSVIPDGSSEAEDECGADTSSSFTSSPAATMTLATPVAVIIATSAPAASDASNTTQGPSATTLSYITGTRGATLTTKAAAVPALPYSSPEEASGESSCAADTLTVTQPAVTVYVTMPNFGAAPLSSSFAVLVAADTAAPTTGMTTTTTTTTTTTIETAAAAVATGDSGDGDTCDDAAEGNYSDDASADSDTYDDDGEGDDSGDDGDEAWPEEQSVTSTVGSVPGPTASNASGSVYPTGAGLLKSRIANLH